MSASFRPGERVRVHRHRCPAETGTVEAGGSGRVIVRMDCAGVRMAFQAAELEPDLPPVPEPVKPMMLGPSGPSYPGPYAVPGVMSPGLGWPAEPVTGYAPAPPSAWRYTEVYALIYPQYLDTCGAADPRRRAGRPRTT